MLCYAVLCYDSSNREIGMPVAWDTVVQKEKQIYFTFAVTSIKIVAWIYQGKFRMNKIC